MFQAPLGALEAALGPTTADASLIIAECDSLALQNRLIPVAQKMLATQGHVVRQVNLTTNADVSRSGLAGAFQDDADIAISTDDLPLSGQVVFICGLHNLSNKNQHRFWPQLAKLTQENRSRPQLVIWLNADQVAAFQRAEPELFAQSHPHLKFHLSHGETEPGFLQQPDLVGQIQTYLSRITQDSGFNTWTNLYVPLRVQVENNNQDQVLRSALTSAEIANLESYFSDRRSFPAHAALFKQGEIGTEAYILLSGSVEVLVTPPGGMPTVIARLHRGDIIGEVSLIQNVPRIATVRSLTACQVLILNKAQLRLHARKLGSLLDLLHRLAEQRTRTTQNESNATSLHRFASKESDDHNPPTDALRELLNHTADTTLYGEVGTGKSTLLRYLTLRLALRARNQLDTGQLAEVPLFLSLDEDTSSDALEPVIIKAAQSLGLIPNEHTISLSPNLRRYIDETGRIRTFIIILDAGLRLLQDPDRLQRQLQRLQQQFPCRFIISSRDLPTQRWSNHRYLQLQPLARSDVETFCLNYLNSEQGKRLARDLYSNPRWQPLTRRPLLLYTIIHLARRHDTTLLKNQGLHLDHLVDALLNRIDWGWWDLFNRPVFVSPHHRRKDALAELGFILQESNRHHLPTKAWQALLQKHFIPSTINIAVSELLLSGLIELTPDGGVQFSHPLFQAFFAACYLNLKQIPLERYLEAPHLRRQWYETIILLYGIVDDQTDFFSRLIGSDNDLSRLWLAAQCLAHSGKELAPMLDNLRAALPDRLFVLYFSLGLAAELSRRYPEALTYLLEAAVHSPGNPEIQYQLAALYRRLNQYDRAIEHLERSIQLQPDFIDAYNLLGLTYYNQEKLAEAITLFEMTIRLEPGNAHHYYNLGVIFKLQGDYQQAYELFQQALECRSDYPEARSQFDLLARALESEAIQQLTRVPTLRKLTLEQLHMLTERLTVQEHEAGDIVFHLGELGHHFYIIESGTIELLAPDLQKPYLDGVPQTQVQVLEQDDRFGEIALLQTVPRMATARCAGPVRLLALARDTLEDILRHYPPIAPKLIETIKPRLFPPHHRAESPPQTDLYDPAYLQDVLNRQKEVTIIMGDIHGSTLLTNAIGPELMATFLDEYLIRMSNIVVGHGGVLDRSLGDSVMGVFGQSPERPDSDTSSAMRALMAAYQMRQTYLTLREAWRVHSPVFMQTGMGIGISTDQVKIGTVGPEGAMVGAAVHVASKLSKMAILGRDESEIYIDRKTHDLIGDGIDVETLDPQYVLRKSGGIELEVYHVVSDAGHIPAPESPTPMPTAAD